jgi:hypothetical protein
LIAADKFRLPALGFVNVPALIALSRSVRRARPQCPRPWTDPVRARHRRPGERRASVGKAYEYRFVRLGQYWGSAAFGVRDKDRGSYQDIVHEHARDGWRLVQIFAPGIAAFGAAKYYELIFERESAESAAAS